MKRLFALLLVLLPLPAAAQGPGYGAALAQRWCMACHIVEPAPKTASANGIPSFSAIAAKSTTTAEQLKAYLRRATRACPTSRSAISSVRPWWTIS